MVKTNLPVILLKGLVLLPYQEVRLEINNEISKKVIDISKLYHDSEVLIVCPLDTLEESPDTSDLPKIGVVGKIKSKIDLPNGNSRIVINGIRRVKVYSYVNYSNEEDVLESIIAPIDETINDEVEETALLRKLINELDRFISINPFISNSILSSIKGVVELDKITDMIANFLPLTFEKKINLMLDKSATSRAKYLIKEINIECAILDLEEKIEQDLKQDLDESQKEFILKEKVKIIKEELGEKDSKLGEIEEFKVRLEKIKAPKNIVEKINKEIKRYELTPEISPEISVIRNYIDVLLNIPWTVKKKEEKNLIKIEKKLNSTHYGLKDVKSRIIEYVAVKNYSKNNISPIICLIGPPGVGKTTFASSIAKALNREFAKISLGGLFDTAELTGHRRTYIGSNPGKIITSLIKTKTKNPVILLDEIDKLNSDARTDPSSVLLDVLDRTQNKKFIDNYVCEEVDLSEVLFIVTANDKNNIPPALYDRLEVIEIFGYTDYEKLDIAKNYIIPNILDNYSINKKDLIIKDDALLYIMECYTKESGVRELNRLINKIIRKVITEFSKNKKEIKKLNITLKDIYKYLGNEKYIKNKKEESKVGFIKALACTSIGGEIIDCEVESYEGNYKEIVTGSLGKVMKESVGIAFSYIKSNASYFKIDLKGLENKVFHLNFRQGAIPKDGPSAGITITTMLISYLTNTKIESNISMTGEITLLGDILPIGGLKEKASVAYKNGIDTIFIPFLNKNDLDSIEDEIKQKIKFIPVKNYKEIYEYIFDKKNKK